MLLNNRPVWDDNGEYYDIYQSEPEPLPEYYLIRAIIKKAFQDLLKWRMEHDAQSLRHYSVEGHSDVKKFFFEESALYEYLCLIAKDPDSTLLAIRKQARLIDFPIWGGGKRLYSSAGRAILAKEDLARRSREGELKQCKRCKRELNVSEFSITCLRGGLHYQQKRSCRRCLKKNALYRKKKSFPLSLTPANPVFFESG